MNKNQIDELIAQNDVRTIAQRIATDLDVPSPLIGADAPPERAGPEEAYINAAEQFTQEFRQNFGQAVNTLLLEEASQIATSGNIRRPFLLFNLFALLEAVRIDAVEGGMRALRDFPDELRQGLSERNENLYAQFLLALAVNQEKPSDPKFWLDLIDSSDVTLIRAGIVGLRESSWENALHYLPTVEQKYRDYPELGEFSHEVMLLLDTYPDQNWPGCAREFLVANDTNSQIPALVDQHSQSRYVPQIEELQSAPDTALNIVQTHGSLAQIDKQIDGWSKRNPANALVGNV